MTTKFTAKLGTTRAGERTRIWLEGKRLEAHGWMTGDTFARHWVAGGLVLRKVEPAEFELLGREARGRVSGGPGRPVIDITGARVADTFKGNRVEVTLGKTIRVADESEA